MKTTISFDIIEIDYTSFKHKSEKELSNKFPKKYYYFPTTIPFTDASERGSEFKLERAVSTNG